jgi:host factor-I protein
VNRKLIRTTLAEVKERESHQQRETPHIGNVVTAAGGGSRSGGASGGGANVANQSSQQSGGRQQQQRRVPPIDTNAETFYYKKQMDAHTLMVIVLQDGEEIEGTIEWYDRNALKVNRQGAPNLLLLKHNIKYMYKADDRDREDGAESS